ncbi:ATP synthase F1 subunit gamma [Mycoplasmopsis columbinasalis]|uniref:ATP synthase gamma chain n=1 Tax=Mycoplasmopsis columbinasalis TaxID=114880 RepID=A0A449B9W4_9BACT|nr:ATP synthase F1 subunit gamma [Mycoplasmopsis columbinasalis]VEU77973.1 ATP synthase gamma chain [Mycoplasmopsis columbinasalis]
MAGLSTLKNRMNAVHSIKKITHAMELVSASKLKKNRYEYNNVKVYADAVKRSFDAIFQHIEPQEVNRLLQSNKTNKHLYIVFTGDLGLAGSYNSSVIKLARQTIKPNDKVLVIGSKGMAGLHKYFEKQIIYYKKSEEFIDHYLLVKEIAQFVQLLYREEKFETIRVIYSKYVNNLVQKETCENIFPYEFKNQSNLPKDSKFLHAAIEFEPSPEIVIQEAIPQYLNAQIFFAYSSSKLSELAARRSAMETATDNANELLEDLNIKYNRKRQSNITQEINEIVSGANAV